MLKTRIIISTEIDPYLNQSIEEMLFNQAERSPLTLFIWRNRDSVVFGKHQIPWIECDVMKACQENVRLVRRTSGGGAVYHDLGNINFSFIACRKEFNLEKNFSIVIEALKDAGIEAHKNQRGDILVNGFKISGSAYRCSSKAALHHGTLLVSSNLQRLKKFLTPLKGMSIVSRAVLSRPSKVANLKDFAPVELNRVLEALVESFQHTFGKGKIETIETIMVEDLPKIVDNAKKFASWEWIFGFSPTFEMHLGKLRLNVEDGIVKEASIIQQTSSSIRFPMLEGQRLDCRMMMNILSTSVQLS